MMHARTALLMIDAQRAFERWVLAGQRRNRPDAGQRIADLPAGSVFLPEMPQYAPLTRLGTCRDEPVLVKTVSSAFIRTDLQRRLRADGVERVVPRGATTNHRVETTTRMAGKPGFEAWLVRDACWTFDRVGPGGGRHAADILAAIEAERSRRYGASWSSSG